MGANGIRSKYIFKGLVHSQISLCLQKTTPANAHELCILQLEEGIFSLSFSRNETLKNKSISLEFDMSC